MAKYVIDAGVVLRMLEEGIEVPEDHRLLAPTLIRSQVLAALYAAVRSGDLPEDEALERLARFARMRIRYLGDKVLRRRAWRIADELGWDSTDDAEYVALTQLQADALITLDRALVAAVEGIVPTATIDVLGRGGRPGAVRT